MPAETTVDAVISTELLNTRRERSRDFGRENAILQNLALGLADSDNTLLARLVDAAVSICDAGSAGLSLHGASESGEANLLWVAVGGAYAKYLGGTLPVFSPCGVCLDRGRAELFSRPERVFTYLSDVRPEIVEALVIPMSAGGCSLGTIWIASHAEGPGFTLGDLAIMTTLANFTAAALTLLGRERAAQERARRERQDREQAEDVNRRKDEFLSTISHELRTPLHAILSWSELLIDGLSPADAREAAVSIHRNAERQAHLVDDLLDSSRFVSGPRLDLRPIDLAGLVVAVVDSARPAFVAKGLTVRVARPSGAITVLADAPRLHQALANIVGNAVKFTPAGGTVQVEVDSDRTKAVVRIADTGVGMSASFLPRAFTRFSQADSSSSRRQGGLGLGLPIAREIIDAHAGSIEAHSDAPGCGATFTVTLPVAPAPVAPAESVPAAKAASLAGLRVLVVDDEPDARDALATVLRHRQATVETAGSAAAALEILTNRPPDVLLTDIAMPGDDGYALLKWVRQHVDLRVRQVPAIALTAHSSEPDRDRIKRAGFDALVVKPVPARDLVEVIAGFLKAGDR